MVPYSFYRGGLIHHVQLPANSLQKDFPALAARNAIQSVEAINCPPGSLEFLDVPDWYGLKMLSLWPAQPLQEGPHHFPFHKLAGAPGIRVLRLGGPLSDSFLPSINRSPISQHLELLILGPQCRNEQLLTLARQPFFQSLRELDLSGSQVTIDGLEQIHHLDLAQHLEVLIFSNSQFTENLADRFQQLTAWHQLKRLYIGHTLKSYQPRSPNSPMYSDLYWGFSTSQAAYLHDQFQQMGYQDDYEYHMLRNEISEHRKTEADRLNQWLGRSFATALELGDPIKHWCDLDE